MCEKCSNCSVLDSEIEFESKMQDEFDKQLEKDYFESLKEME